jgi:hypothetical protein
MWRRRRRIIVVGSSLIVGVVLWASGGLEFLMIVVERQAQSVRQCVFGGSAFDASAHGLRVIAREGYCILPHRLYPEDGSLHVLPRGFYFVLAEYFRGSVLLASQTGIYIEPANGRTPQDIVHVLDAGGFLAGATREDRTNGEGLAFIILRDTLGADGEARFDRAYLLSPDGQYLVTILARRAEDRATFDAVLREMMPITTGGVE